MQLKPIVKLIGTLLALIGLIFTAYKLLFKEEVIRVALVGPMSGEHTSVGRSFRQGINLYLDMVNQKRGVNGKKIVLDIFDDQNNRDEAQKRAAEIVAQKRAVAVIGHHYSGCSISAGKVYKENGIPAISPASTNVNVTLDNEWYFRSSFNDNIQGRFLAAYAKKVLGQDAVSIIYENDPYGSYLATVFEETAKAIDMEIKYKWTFDVNNEFLEQDLEQIVNELRYKTDAGAIFLATHAGEGSRLIKKMKDALVTNSLLAPDAFASEAFQREFTDFPKERSSPGFYTDGIYVTTPLIFDTTNEKGLKFRESYMERYKEEPGWHAAFAYDTAMVIVEAIRHTKIQGKTKTIAEDREKIRNYLAKLNNVYDAIEGVTGYNYFDAQGDSQKAIFMGVYKNQKLISALTQFRAIPNVNEVPNFKDAVKAGRVMIFDGKYSYKTNVVYTGININEISELDPKDFSYQLDFYLWFRYQGDINVHDIEFLNAVDPILLETPAHAKEKDELTYRLYHVKGKFRADFLPNLHIFGQHILGVSFRPRSMDRNNLILVKDVLGMRLTSDRDLLEKMVGEKVLSPVYGWKMSQVWFFQDIAEKDLLGDPEHFNVRGGTLEYSRFNLGIRIIEDQITIRRIIPNKLALWLLIFSFIASVMLAYFVRGTAPSPLPNLKSHDKTVWFFQVFFVDIILLSLEVFLLDRFSENLTQAYFEIIVTTFDILWWLISAFLVTVFVERFIWLPAEERTKQPIPKIVRGLISLIIYILAIMGIVAFVFDQKLTSFLATSGVIAMIVGLAVQINIANIFSGIAINIERPFKIDDWVKIGSFTEGKVIDINWRTTRLKTRDDTVLSIPNSQASESSIENFSLPDNGYWKYFTIHTDPIHPPERVKKILLDAAMSTKGISKRIPPATRFLGLTAGMTGQSESWAANYLISVYVEDYGMKFAHNEIIWLNVWKHLKQAGIKHIIERKEVQMTLKRPKEEAVSRPLAILQGTSIFKPFSEKAKIYISERMKSKYFHPNDVVVRCGEAGDSLFIIAEGVLSVWVPDNSGDIEVGRLGVGDFFGEMALLTGEPRAATVMAISETHLYEITKKDIYPLIKLQPEISRLLSEVLTERKMDTEAKRRTGEGQRIDRSTLATQILGKIQDFFGFKKN
jgi:branched-chain amino acid transport system substrate-binding protein